MPLWNFICLLTGSVDGLHVGLEFLLVDWLCLVCQSMFNFFEGMEFIFPSMEFVFLRWNLFSLTGIRFPSMEFVFPQWNLFSSNEIYFPSMVFVQHEIGHVSPVGQLIIFSGKNFWFYLSWISDCWQMTSWWTTGLLRTCFDSGFKTVAIFFVKY